MKFLLMSGSGDGMGLLLRLKAEGNQVAAWIRNDRAKHNYDGLINKVKRWESYLSPGTVVIFDSGGGRTADRMRSQGYPVIGRSVFHDQLEEDRDLAFNLMENAGIKVPHSEKFTDYKSAKAYVKKRDTRLVFKPSGEMSDMMSYVSYDPEDMIYFLERAEKKSSNKPEFDLQDYVEGLAISSEGWFDGSDWVRPFNHTIERKKTLNDNLGADGGCAGNIVWEALEGNRVISEGVECMGPYLSAQDYIGPLDLNTIINNQGVWALEFTPRFGYDALPAFMELYDGEMGQLLSNLARKQPAEMKLKQGFSSAVRLTIPPYPTEKAPGIKDVPIRGFEREDRPHLYFYDIALDPDNELVSSGGWGVIAAVTGWGSDIPSSLEGPYNLLKKARIPDKQYRTDLTSVFAKDHEEFTRLSGVGRSVQPKLSQTGQGIGTPVPATG